MCLVPQRPEHHTGSFGIGATDGCEPLWVLELKPWPSVRVTNVLTIEHLPRLRDKAFMLHSYPSLQSTGVPDVY